MIIELIKNIDKQSKDNFFNYLSKMNIKYKTVSTQISDYVILPSSDNIDIRSIGNINAVKDVHKVTDNFKLVSKQWKMFPSQINIADNINIGNNDFQIIAGPCAIEDEEQVAKIVETLIKTGTKIMRGGVFKPRSSPYSFRGHGLEALKLMHKYCKPAGIQIVTEVMKSEQIDQIYDYVDIIQVGARNSQNFNLLDALGNVDKPVLLKRGISGTIEELLQSAEYIFTGGNEKIILCERGIRTYETSYRNTLDLNAVPLLKQKSHLPVIVDPSHGTGIRSLIEPMSLAAIAAGADGLIIEIHPDPFKALSDGDQSLNLNDTEKLFEKVNLLNSFLKNQTNFTDNKSKLQ